MFTCVFCKLYVSKVALKLGIFLIAPSIKGEGGDFQKVSNWYPKPSEIVDDVLYIAGPLKNEVRKQKRDSLDVNQEFVNQLLALPLIPSDKFDPVNTLSKRKQKKASNNNATTSGHSGAF